MNEIETDSAVPSKYDLSEGWADPFHSPIFLYYYQSICVILKTVVLAMEIGEKFKPSAILQSTRGRVQALTVRL